MNIMKRAHYEALREELDEILETMDIPEKRVGDLRWLSRNLDVNNGSHPKIDRARDILGLLLRGEDL